MKPYYSILFASIRSAINEQISIAMLFVDRNKIFFKYSGAKLKIVKDLLSIEHAKLLEDQLRSLKQQADILNAKLSADEIFPVTEDQYKPFSKSYLEYLNRYSQNTLQISAATELFIDSVSYDSQAIFSNLYNLHIETESENLLLDQTPISIQAAKTELFNRNKNRLNINVRSKKLKDFYKFEKALFLLPTKIDFLGKNGAPVTGQFLNMHVETKWLKDRLSHYYHLLDEFKAHSATNYFISNEPDKQLFSENHKIWQQIKDNKQIRYIHLSEIEKIDKDLSDYDVQPVFTEDDTIEE